MFSIDIADNSRITAAPHRRIPRADGIAVGLARPEDAIGAPLSAADRDALRRLPSAAARADFRAGRLAARRAVASIAGIRRLDRIEILRRDGAAPVAFARVAGGPRALPFALSIAHRDGFGAAVASATHARVGIDLERIGAVAPGQGRYFLSGAERRAADAAGPSAWWALKEAAWKAAGCGDDVFLAALEVHGDVLAGGDVTVRSLSVFGAELAASGGLTVPFPGFVLAVIALAGGES